MGAWAGLRGAGPTGSTGRGTWAFPLPCLPAPCWAAGGPPALPTSSVDPGLVPPPGRLRQGCSRKGAARGPTWEGATGRRTVSAEAPDHVPGHPCPPGPRPPASKVVVPGDPARGDKAGPQTHSTQATHLVSLPQLVRGPHRATRARMLGSGPLSMLLPLPSSKLMGLGWVHSSRTEDKPIPGARSTLRAPHLRGAAPLLWPTPPHLWGDPRRQQPHAGARRPRAVARVGPSRFPFQTLGIYFSSHRSLQDLLKSPPASSVPHQGLLPPHEAPLFRTHHALPPEPTAGPPHQPAGEAITHSQNRGGRLRPATHGEGLRPHRPHAASKAGANPAARPTSAGCPVPEPPSHRTPQHWPPRWPKRIPHRGSFTGLETPGRGAAHGGPGAAGRLWDKRGTLLGLALMEPPDQEEMRGRLGTRPSSHGGPSGVGSGVDCPLPQSRGLEQAALG